jgi:hypothetical protein
MWTKQVSGTTKRLYAIAYGNGLFVAAGNNGTILNSTNGTDWTINNTGITTSDYFASIVYGNHQFMAVGGNNVYTSKDGKIWTSQKIGVPQNINGVTYGNNQFLVVGDMKAILSLHSDSTTVAVQQRNKTSRTKQLTISNIHNVIVVTLSAEFNTVDKIKVDLFSVTGKRSFSVVGHASGRNLSIPVSGIPAGKYIICVSELGGKKRVLPYAKVE